MSEIRIDKYLWAIRAFKTRNEAAEACKGGKVKLSGVNVKPSKEVHAGDVLHVRKGLVTYVYRVLQPTEQRVGAKLVPQFAEDLTPPEELEKQGNADRRRRDARVVGDAVAPRTREMKGT